MKFPAVTASPDRSDAGPEPTSGALFRFLSGRRREMAFWILNLLFWGIIGVIGLFMSSSFRSTIPNVEWAVFVRVASGFVMTSGLRWCYRSYHRRTTLRWGRWPLVLGASLAVALLEFAALHTLDQAGVHIPGSPEALGVRLFFVRIFTMVVWSSLYQAFHLLEDEHTMEIRATRAELAARENELRHLQAQLNPHFMFNALNAVLACRNDPDAVREMTEGLASYLRFLFKEARPLEPLSRELEALEKFLTVQAFQFKESLVCRIQWAAEVRSVMVPPMLIQPLIEDALHHRPPSVERPLHLWLTFRVENGFLNVTLSSTSNLDTSGPISDPGPGIRSLRHRLNLQLGPLATVDQHAADGWIRTTVHIPMPDSSPRKRPASA